LFFLGKLLYSESGSEKWQEKFLERNFKMCQWISFYINNQGTIKLGNLRSHSRIAELEKINEKDPTWHEVEWTTEDHSGIIVRGFENGRDVNNEKLVTLIASRFKNRTEFLEWAGPQLKELDCSGSNLTELPELPNCETLDCYNNQLTKLPELPKCQTLSCYNNKLTKLPELPNCKILYCRNNKLTKLPELPKCQYLYCWNNKLTKLPELPKCQTLYCNNNKLTKLPELPKCQTLYCADNKLTELPELPKCQHLYCHNNYM
jgi:Leucine-rich repeat (LRR) protein